MGRPFFVTFEFDPSSEDAPPYYSCRGCFQDSGEQLPPDQNRMTHLAWGDQRHLFIRDIRGRHSLVFKTICYANVTVGQPEVYMHEDIHFCKARVYCNRCNRPIGRKLVEFPAGTSIDPNSGTCTLEQEKIDLWKGEQRLPHLDQ